VAGIWIKSGFGMGEARKKITWELSPADYRKRCLGMLSFEKTYRKMVGTLVPGQPPWELDWFHRSG